MTLEDNVKEYGLTYFGMGDERQGIVHIIVSLDLEYAGQPEQSPD
jgi:hypothetical protein